jgi:hypothetical protein
MYWSIRGIWDHGYLLRRLAVAEGRVGYHAFPHLEYTLRKHGRDCPVLLRHV